MVNDVFTGNAIENLSDFAENYDENFQYQTFLI